VCRRAIAASALVALVGAATSSAAPAPVLRSGWPPSGESAASVAVDGAGLVYTSVPRTGMVVLNPDGTRRRVIRSSLLGPPVRGRDGRIYTIRYRGEQLQVVTRDGRLEDVGGQIPFGHYLDLTDVSPAGKPVGVLSFKGEVSSMSALGPGEVVYQATPGGTPVPGEAAVPARLTAIAADGSMLWSRDLPTDPRAIAGAADGGVRLALADGEVLALAPDGTELWSSSVDGAPYGLATSADGTTYVTARPALPLQVGGQIVALGSDGARIFGPYELGGEPGVPIVGPTGTVFVTTERRHVVAEENYLIALSPAGEILAALRLPGVPLRVAAAPDGSAVVPSLAYGPGTDVLVATDAPVRAGPPARSGLRISRRRFRSAGPVSVCAAVGRCRPAVPLGTTLSLWLGRRATIGIAVTRAGARAPFIRTTLGDFRRGHLWIRFDGRSLPAHQLGLEGRLRALCGPSPSPPGPCRPLRPGGYRVTVTVAPTSGSPRNLHADVVVVP